MTLPNVDIEKSKLLAYTDYDSLLQNIRSLIHRVPHNNFSILFCVLFFNYETCCASNFDLYLRKELKISAYEA